MSSSPPHHSRRSTRLALVIGDDVLLPTETSTSALSNIASQHFPPQLKRLVACVSTEEMTNADEMGLISIPQEESEDVNSSQAHEVVSNVVEKTILESNARKDVIVDYKEEFGDEFGESVMNENEKSLVEAVDHRVSHMVQVRTEAPKQNQQMISEPDETRGIENETAVIKRAFISAADFAVVSVPPQKSQFSSKVFGRMIFDRQEQKWVRIKKNGSTNNDSSTATGDTFLFI